MKKLFVFVLLLTAMVDLNAQGTKPVTKPVVKPVTKPVVKPVASTAGGLKTHLDSLSYALGEMTAFNFLQKDTTLKVNSVAFGKALDDILGKKKTQIDDVAANALLNGYFIKLEEAKIKPTIDEGRKFLAENKTKPGVKTTASGLQYEVITQGTGIKPTLVDTFVANYRGTLLNGTEFDASANRGQPLTLGVNQVISGWKEVLQLMPVGSKYKIWIPYELAYGPMGQGQIPGGAMLIFEMELIDVKKANHQ